MVLESEPEGIKSMHIFKVGGYVKLAKLWEKHADEAIPLHFRHFESRYQGMKDTELVDVYIDITGKKHIYERDAMVRLLADCKAGKVNTIASQTRAYLAANHEEFCFLIHYLFGLVEYVDIVTEDREYNIDTITDRDNQRAELERMADALVRLKSTEYAKWEHEVEMAIRRTSSRRADIETYRTGE